MQVPLRKEGLIEAAAAREPRHYREPDIIPRDHTLPMQSIMAALDVYVVENTLSY